MSGWGGVRKWRRKNSQIGSGYKADGRYARRIVVGFDDPTFDEIRQLAVQHGVAIGAVIRQLSVIGLEALEDRSQVLAFEGVPSAPPAIPVPAWVPEALRDEYRDLAELEGEEAAAAYVRAQKRQVAA